MKFYLIFLFSAFMHFALQAQCGGADPTANLSNWDNNLTIQGNFNDARREEETNLNLTANCLGNMTEISGGWSNASFDEIALYIHNSEREARGKLPFYGVETHLDGVSQAHSDWQIANEVFAHGGNPTLGSNSNYSICGNNNDQCGTSIAGSSPFDRMNQNAPLASQWQTEGENIAVSVTSGSSISSLMGLVSGLYRFMYTDSGSSWGHRHNMLKVFTNDWGDTGNEGFIGVGVSQGGPYKSCAFSCTSWAKAAITTIDYYDPKANATNYTFSTALPVELISFQGQIENRKTVLRWATASQQNSEYFSVERSVDGIQFDEIGYVDVSGDTELHKDYSFIDNSPFDGINYYRLRIVDFDGQETQSDIVSVNFFEKAPIHFYPNPVHNVLHVSVGDGLESPTFYLYDLVGRLVKTKTIVKKSLDMSKIADGAYIYVIKDNAGLQLKKGIILKK